MNDVEYRKANENDYYDVVDLIDLVFSQTYSSNYSDKNLPVIYKKKNFMAGIHYLAKENGRLVGSISSYPAIYALCDERIKVSSISCVAVHRRARSKGYMRKLMEMAINEMRENGTDLSFLHGQRQRYEYYEYTHCGVQLHFSCTSDNIRHYFKHTSGSTISLKELQENDVETYDKIYHIYHKRKDHIIRPYDIFEDIMNTWGDKTIGIYQNETLIGYLSSSMDYGSIVEFNLNDLTLIGDVLKIYFTQFKRDKVIIEAFSPDTELISCLSKFTESVSIVNAGSFNVLNYPAVLTAFLKLKCETTVLPDGFVTINIQNKCNIKIEINGNVPSVSLTNEKPDLECSHLEAMQLLFSPVSFITLGQFRDNAFLRSIIPIPLFIRRNDLS